jgi:hypothetical protein
VSDIKEAQKQIQPYREVTRLIGEILVSTKGNNIRILEHLLSFAEYQFGKKVIGKHYRERGDGDRISNWTVEIGILYYIISTVADFYSQNTTISSIICYDMSFPYLERLLSLLHPWVINLDIDASNGNDSLSEEQKIELLKK